MDPTLYDSCPKKRLEQTHEEERPCKDIVGDFPGGPVVKNPPASAGDMGLIPALGRSHVLWSS